MKYLKLISMLALAFGSLPVAAHGLGGDRAMGVVASIAAQRIVVTTADDHAVSFAITPETRFVRGEMPTSAEEVKPGERVVVHEKHVGDSLRAIEVKLARETDKK